MAKTQNVSFVISSKVKICPIFTALIDDNKGKPHSLCFSLVAEHS